MPMTTDKKFYTPIGQVTLKEGAEHVDLEKVYRMLSRTYWGERRSLDRIQTALDHSVCFSVHHTDEVQSKKMVGFGRLVTDFSTIGYITDVVVDEAFRGNGIGTEIINTILNYSKLKGCYVTLSTKDANDYYSQFGLKPDDTFMSRVNGDEPV